MARSNSLPQHALLVRSYGQLHEYAHAFGAGHLNLLLLCGPPGTGKSRCLREAVGDRACWVDGTASAFGIYRQAYEHRDRALVLDDLDGLDRDRAAVRLLKALCQTEPAKTLRWQTDARTLDRDGIPRQFTTTSRVAVVGNQWHSLTADVAALEDRGHLLVFDPPPHEVHRHAATWFWDQPVFDFVGAHLHLLGRHSLRTYVLAWELKRAGLDWQGGVLGRCLRGAALQVARLKADPHFPSEEERVRAFVAAGAGCRATYFNQARKLRAGATVPSYTLTALAPAGEGHSSTHPGSQPRRQGRYLDGR